MFLFTLVAGFKINYQLVVNMNRKCQEIIHLSIHLSIPPSINPSFNPSILRPLLHLSIPPSFVDKSIFQAFFNFSYPSIATFTSKIYLNPKSQTPLLVLAPSNPHFTSSPSNPTVHSTSKNIPPWPPSPPNHHHHIWGGQGVPPTGFLNTHWETSGIPASQGLLHASWSSGGGATLRATWVREIPHSSPRVISPRPRVPPWVPDPPFYFVDPP